MERRFFWDIVWTVPLYAWCFPYHSYISIMEGRGHTYSNYNLGHNSLLRVFMWFHSIVNILNNLPNWCPLLTTHAKKKPTWTRPCMCTTEWVLHLKTWTKHNYQMSAAPYGWTVVGKKPNRTSLNKVISYLCWCRGGLWWYWWMYCCWWWCPGFWRSNGWMI